MICQLLQPSVVVVAAERCREGEETPAPAAAAVVSDLESDWSPSFFAVLVVETGLVVLLGRQKCVV
jgi:hypothetical protein